MNTLYLERSTGNARNGNWVEELQLDGVERIVVGTGPGSFAGIRSALAFAQGFALGKKCEVLGLPSACAIAAEVYARSPTPVPCSQPPVPRSPFPVPCSPFPVPCSPFPVPSLAIIGDSRRGMAWVALFKGYSLERDIFQVKQEDLSGTVPPDCLVVTPDAQRIEPLLREAFGERYLGGQLPTEEGLRLFAEANPSVLKPEPLPIYLNPAVR